MGKKIIALAFLPLMLASCAREGTLPSSAANQEEGGSSSSLPQETESSSSTSEMEGMSIKATIGENEFAIDLVDSPSSRDFLAMLPLSLTMEELNGNEKYAYLDSPIAADPYSPGTIEAGDFMLYGTSCLVIFYDTFMTGYTYTRLGRFSSTDGLADALGSGDISVDFSAMI